MGHPANMLGQILFPPFIGKISYSERQDTFVRAMAQRKKNESMSPVMNE